MTEEPQSPADPRPNGEPYYIDSECPKCGTLLELWDEVYDTGEEPWYDEWACPNCQDGCYMDWPDEQHDELKNRVDSGESMEVIDCD